MPGTKRIIYALIILMTLTLESVYSQKGVTDGKIHFIGQTGYAHSNGDNTPYWLTARRQGIVSTENSNGYLRLAASYGNRIGKSDFRYNLITDIFINHGHNSRFFVQQANADISWRWLTLSVGSKERFSEDKGSYNPFTGSAFASSKVNTLFPNLYTRQVGDLSSGSLVYSGNSRPVPQIRIEVPEFTTIPGTNEWLHMKGHIAYGGFTDGNFQEEFSKGNSSTKYGKNILYHSKAAFIRIGKPSKFTLEFEGGVEMYSQFAGDIFKHGKGKIVSMPSSISDFFKALIPLSGGKDTPLDEQTNISGNQIGNWHAAFILHTKPFDIRLYGEHMFEDFSQLFFFEYQSNKEGKRGIIYYPWKDIMIGIRISNKSGYLPFISDIQYEYMGTYDQSGALYHDPSKNFNEQMDGVDNYYNHGIYPGWHHWGMGMGNPLVVSPLYNKNGALEFRSNRLISHNIGVNGTFGKKMPMAYRIQYTYSENWGTYLNPLREKGYTTSLLGELAIAPKDSNWSGSLSIGYDHSNIIGNNFGAMITITHIGSIIFNR